MIVGTPTLPALPYRLLQFAPRRTRFPIAQRLGGRRVLRIRSAGLNWELDLEDHLQRQIAAHSHELYVERMVDPLLRMGDLVVDVGANVGAHSLRWARHVGPSGSVLAFEPVPPNYRALQRNIALNPGLAIEAMPLGLSDATGTLRLAHCRQGATSGGYSAIGADGEGFDVGVVTLDGFLAEHRHGPVRLIKIDVEGWEAPVLRGSRATIRRYLPFIMLERNTAYGLAVDEEIDALVAEGYRMQTLGSNVRDLLLIPPAAEGVIREE